MPKYLLNIPDRQWQAVRSLSDRTDLAIAELLRRAIDYAFQENGLNAMVPCMSGEMRRVVKR